MKSGWSVLSALVEDAADGHLDRGVLRELSALGLANDTAVAFLGDHGQHAGEQNLWEKMTNFENGVRIPFIVRAPWLGAAAAGRRSDALAEAVDVYRTLSELAGLPVPAMGERAFMAGCVMLQRLVACAGAEALLLLPAEVMSVLLQLLHAACLHSLKTALALLDKAPQAIPEGVPPPGFEPEPEPA